MHFLVKISDNYCLIQKREAHVMYHYSSVLEIYVICIPRGIILGKNKKAKEKHREQQVPVDDS